MNWNKDTAGIVCLYIAGVFSISIAGLATSLGYELAFGISSGCVGFRFFGFTLCPIGVALLLLLCSSFFIPELVVRRSSIYCAVSLLGALAALGVFALVVSSKGEGKSIPGQSYKEYHVESYSKWMQNKVKHNWDNYYKRALVMKIEVLCTKDLDYSFQIHPAFQSGCCEPPRDCNFNSTSLKVSLKLENNGAGDYPNDDCNRWDNNPSTLCFNCESCKAGFLEDVTTRWFLTGLGLVFSATIILLSVTLLKFICVFCYPSSSQGYTPLV